MARLACETCHRCGHCKFTNGHANECGVLLTEAYVSIVVVHEEDAHAPLALDIALRGNEIQVKRLFMDLVAEEANMDTAAILDELLINRRVDTDKLPARIMRLWK